MKKYFFTLLLLLAVLPLGAAKLKLPELTGRVVDNARIFTAEQSAQIESAIIQLEKATGGQMAVLTVKSLNGMPIEWYSIKLAEKWKIGHKGKDNGAILIIALNDRSMRLEIGYGWEGAVNDARAGDIIRELVPYFRANKYGEGTAQAVMRVQEFVTGKPVEGLPPLKQTPRRQPAGSALLIICAIIALAVLSGGRILIIPGFGGGFRGGGGFGGGGGFSGGGGGFGGGGSSGRW
jgi:uncharacterized protein